MKRSIRILCLVLALVMCASTLAGCKKTDPDPALPENTAPVFDPAAYVKGGLDAVYLGRYSDEYLAMLGSTADKCAASYENGMQVSMQVFAAYFGIELDGCSEAVKAELLELMKSMYAEANYSVGAVTQTDTGYTVEVSISPLASVAQAAQNDYPAFAKDAANRLSANEMDKSSQSFKDWWARSIASMVSARVAAPEYFDAQTVTVTLEKNADGAYAFAGTSLSDVDALIVPYPTYAS